MGRPAINLTGQTFGRLTVLERDTTKPSGQGKSAYWLCQCECGNKVSIRSDKLKKGITQSCGCLSKEIHSQIFLKDLTGQIFGRLTVLERDVSKPMGKEHFAYWICKCKCGNKVSIRGDHLRNNTTQSCGCLNSAGEERLNKILQDNQINYKTQYTFSDLRGEAGSLLRFDFAILNKEQDLLGLIEYQGEQHYKPMGYDTEERFQKRQNYDIQKMVYCKTHNIPLLTIPFTDYAQLNYDYLNNNFFSLYGGGTK